MRIELLSLFAAATSLSHAQTHGEGAEGTEMGPVAFLWPADRVWDAQYDNIAPCGSSSGPGNRTDFPLSQGSVALTIADEAWHVAFRMAVSNNPSSQTDFDDQVVNNVTDVDPGHQCYKIDPLEGVAAGTNATIQLEYWAEYEGENNGKNQSFFACADITLVEPKDFKAQVACFNVTTEDFSAPKPSANSSGTLPLSADSNSVGGGLSTGAKAGIAVGAIIGGLVVFGAVGFFLWRRGKTAGLKNRDSYELRAKDLKTPSESTRA